MFQASLWGPRLLSLTAAGGKTTYDTTPPSDTGFISLWRPCSPVWLSLCVLPRTELHFLINFIRSLPVWEGRGCCPVSTTTAAAEPALHRASPKIHVKSVFDRSAQSRWSEQIVWSTKDRTGFIYKIRHCVQRWKSCDTEITNDSGSRSHDSWSLK